MRVLSKLSLFIFLVLFIVFGCKEDPPTPEVETSKNIGVWEVKGDTMIVWERNSVTPLHIKFVYVPSQLYNSDLPGVRFELVDSSITSDDYNDLNIFNTEYQLSVPPSFDMISSNFKGKGFNSSPDSYSYDSVHEVYCENNSSADHLTLEFYNGKDSERKYEFNTEGVGEAIKEIACR